MMMAPTEQEMFLIGVEVQLGLRPPAELERPPTVSLRDGQTFEVNAWQWMEMGAAERQAFRELVEIRQELSRLMVRESEANDATRAQVKDLKGRNAALTAEVADLRRVVGTLTAKLEDAERRASVMASTLADAAQPRAQFSTDAMTKLPSMRYLVEDALAVEVTFRVNPAVRTNPYIAYSDHLSHRSVLRGPEGDRGLWSAPGVLQEDRGANHWFVALGGFMMRVEVRGRP